MRVLVTGGSGFIGMHLCQRLLNLGYEVHILDTRRPSLNLTHHYSLPSGIRYDWVLHLAAKADMIPSIQRPISYHRSNVDLTVKLLDYSVKAGVKRFIYASSTSIYGIPEEYPTPETASADPQCPYALSKYLGELAVMHWGKIYHLPVVSLRITTAYGPGMRSHGAYGSVFKVFLAQKANDAPFTVVGNGEQSRDFIFVDDVCDAFIKAVESNVHGEIFNIGFGQPRKVNELVKLLGDDNQIVFYLPKRPGEPDMTWADINKAIKMLDWHPKIGLESGVKIMLNHLDDWKGEKVWTPEAIEKETEEWFRYLGGIGATSRVN